MGILKWYKRDPRAALLGMASLTLEERGAYNTILDLIYVHDGKLLDDTAALARSLGCDVRVWKRIKARLLELGKLYIYAGCLHNERADMELDEALHRVASSVKANDKRWGTYRQIKALSDPAGLLSTTTYKKVSAKVVPLKTTEK